MLKKYKKMGLAAATCSLLGMGASEGAVILTIAPITGGVSITASGDINTSSFAWAGDFTTGIAGFDYTNEFFRSFGVNVAAEVYSISGASFTGVSSPYEFSNLNLGGSGNSFFVNGAGFTLYGQNANPNGSAPSGNIFSFDFSGVRLGGSLSDFTAGLLWDSNGASAGGETVSLVVVPEPTTNLLLALGAVGLITRRQRGVLRNPS